MSSSSDSEDENIALLQQAVDTNFISDGMFIKVGSSTSKETQKDLNDESLSHTKSIKANTLVQPQKSQRYIDHDEIEDDLNIPKSMQDFVYKKMSKKINESIEFVEISPKKYKHRKRTNEEIGCVRLLKDTDPITQIDNEFCVGSEVNRGRRCEVKRRVVESDNYNDEAKIKMASVSGDSIIQQTDSKGWKSKVKPNKLFKYQEKNSVLYAIEPENEYTKLRKRNNWSENKIARFPWKNHTKNL